MKYFALILHAHYLDEFEEILHQAINIHDMVKPFVSAGSAHEPELRRMLSSFPGEVLLKVVENRGRDILPFLQLCAEAKTEGFQLLIKVHTKRSPHLKNGATWRRDMVGALLQREALVKTLEAFRMDPSLGIVGPHRHYVGLSSFVGANADDVNKIAASVGLSADRLKGAGFFAGSMFAARVDALDPIVNLGFSPEDFPIEDGQLDGTLAHALERCMTLGAITQGMRIATTENLEGEAIPEPTLPFAQITRKAGGLRAVGRNLERAIRHWLRGK